MKTAYQLATLTVAALCGSALLAFAAPATENWENTCAACHGADGKGDTKQGKRLKLKDYSDKASLAGLSDEQLAKIISDGVVVDGKQRKKGYSDQLTPEEIKELVKLVRSFAK